jgi:hypothetical protein
MASEYSEAVVSPYASLCWYLYTAHCMFTLADIIMIRSHGDGVTGMGQEPGRGHWGPDS